MFHVKHIYFWRVKVIQIALLMQMLRDEQSEVIFQHCGDCRG